MRRKLLVLAVLAAILGLPPSAPPRAQDAVPVDDGPGLAAPVPAPSEWAAEPAVKSAPASRADVQLSFAPVVRKVAPAVVNIYAGRFEPKSERSALLDDPVWRRFFSDAPPDGGAPGQKKSRSSLGSGVIVSADGIIVTNVHVIRGANEIRVILADRREFDARLVVNDPRTDLAVLRIDTRGEDLPFLEFYDSDALEVGDLVLAIGNPFGVGQSVSSGIVSALARTSVATASYRFFIQTDAAINPGNSGGALVTMDGRLAGINTAIYSRSGASVGVGFAVPSAMVKTVVAGIATGGKVVRPWLGASGTRVNATLAQKLGMALPRGVLVGRVHPAGPAAAAGLRIGDVVTAVNGLAVDDDQALRFRFATLAVGGNAKLTVIRDRREMALAVALRSAPEEPKREAMRINGRHPLAGATVANLSPAMAELAGLPDDATGVVVLAVAADTPARKAGVQPRDVLRSVNSETVSTTRGLRDALKATAKAGKWRLTLERKGRTVTIVTAGSW